MNYYVVLNPQTMKRKILLVLASKTFRDCEYLVPKAFFEQGGFEVQTTSTSEVSVGRFGFNVQNEYLLENVIPENFDGIYFVGGGGSAEYLENDTAKKLFQSFLYSNKPIAAICAAPRNFLAWGLLKNKKSTGFDLDGVFSKMAVENESIGMPDQKVVVDGLILTANGPEAAEESAIEYMGLLNKTK